MSDPLGTLVAQNTAAHDAWSHGWELFKAGEIGQAQLDVLDDAARTADRAASAAAELSHCDAELRMLTAKDYEEMFA